MTTENESKEAPSSPRLSLAWLLGGIMLALYLFTLSHWSSLDGLQMTANLSGWNSTPELFGPVTYLVTYPLRWLPAAWIPQCLSLFTVACATLSLILLFRSVTLLPHFSTYAERIRNTHPAGLLKIPTAWLPPLLAVLVCGLQLTFWENSVTATGEMFNVLLFACLIWCFLEFRVSTNDAWLYRWGMIYGVSVANNWAMAAFLPAFVLAIMWVKGYNFLSVKFLARICTEGIQALQPRFVGRLLVCCLAGLSLLLLLPLIASLTSSAEFWPTLKLTLQTYKAMMRSVPTYMVLIICLPAGLTILFIGIRWAQISNAPNNIVLLLMETSFNFLCAVLLLACLGTALDLPYSPRIQTRGAMSCLPLYYLGALSIGYLSGYFLLIARPEPAKSWPRPHPLTPHLVRLFSLLVWISLATIPALLCYKNLPCIMQKKNGPLASYAAQLEKTVPPPGAIILSEDTGRLNCLNRALTRAGQSSKYVLVNASSLGSDSSSLEYLDKKNPDLKLANLVTNQFSQITNAAVLVDVMQKLAKTHDLYFLHPAYNIYFEVFRLEPHGLYYKLTIRNTKSDVLPSAILKENFAFWSDFETNILSSITNNLIPIDNNPVKLTAKARIIKELISQPEKDHSARVAGGYYSGNLDTWGVALQKNGMIKEAGHCFDLASQLNPKNIAAGINQQYNKDVQENKNVPFLSMKDIMEKYGTFRTWNKISGDGPIDEPSLCCNMGKLLAAAGFYRQSIEQLERSKDLAPGNPDPAGALASVLLSCSDYVGALSEANQMLRDEPKSAEGLMLKGTALLKLKAYDQAILPLNRLIALTTNNFLARFTRSSAYLESGKLDMARNEYESMLKTDSAPEMFLGYYGLGEVAYRRKDASTAITNYTIFLEKSGTNSSFQITQAQRRLEELKPGKR